MRLQTTANSIQKIQGPAVTKNMRLDEMQTDKDRMGPAFPKVKPSDDRCRFIPLR